MPIITISRQMGSGGIPIAHQVAEKLNYTLVDGEAIMAAAAAHGLSAEAIEQADEKPPHFVDKLDTKQILDLHLIELIILEYALKGNVIIYGRGGQDLLKDIKSILRVRIIAPFENENGLIPIGPATWSGKAISSGRVSSNTTSTGTGTTRSATTW